MRRTTLILVTVLCVATISLAAEPPKPMRVLFVGNSLTYANDLPGMVARLGALDGRPIEAVTLARPNYSLGDHLEDAAIPKLARRRWDLVVLQQGPSSLAESRRDLIRDSKRIDALFEDPLAMLMVWPSRRYAASWDRVTESYAQAAQAVDGLLIPAGAAIRAAPTLPLLSEDGFHPSVAGTYLAALVTYRAMTGRLPASVDLLDAAQKVAGAPLTLNDEELKLLVSIAKMKRSSAPTGADGFGCAPSGGCALSRFSTL
ncbi:MAG: SGNH/GDSL hydrolase family protein [Thermoanaerobaculia bacterium]